MYSWFVIVLLLASAAYCSGGQGAVGWGGGCWMTCAVSTLMHAYQDM